MEKIIQTGIVQASGGMERCTQYRKEGKATESAFMKV